MPAKKSARARTTPAVARTAEDLTALTRGELYTFYRWTVEPASEAYYEALSADDKDRFNEISALASRLTYSMQTMALGALADRVSAQMPQLRAALADLKREIERQRRTADLLSAASSFLNLLVALLLP